MKNKIFFLILTVSIVVFSSCNFSQSEKKSDKKTEKTPSKVVDIPDFNADSAFEYVKAQTDFGPRVPNTKAQLACAEYLTKVMSAFADTVIVQKCKVRAYNNDILAIKNIISVFNPNASKRILLGAHWDSRPYADHDPDKANRWTPIDGANDGASGVGVLMEVARQLAIQKPEVGVDIIFFDGEDYGEPQSMQSEKQDTWGLGSQYWAKNPHTYGYSANFGVLLDMVGAENIIFHREGFSDYYASGVVNKVWNIAGKAGYGEYFVNEKGGFINDDHYYINEIIGIPMIDIIHLNPESSNGTFFEHWHTVNDNIDVIDKNSLKVVGDVMLNVIYRE
ncbi:MAG: M28 family peptidase [Bacteroidota bacterium]|nr:M28 family peptidase [Bacteroidota bacterium]